MKSKAGKKQKASQVNQRLTLSEYLQQTIQKHQAGSWVEAKAGYQQILTIQPQHADALHLLGIVTAQLGQIEQGIQLIKKAISLNASNADYFLNLAKILHQQGNLTAAIAAYQQAIERNCELKLEIAQQLFTTALQYHQNNQVSQAEQLYQKILEIYSDYADCFNLLGVIAAQREDCEQAVSLFKQAIDLEPKIADYYAHLGNALHTLGNYQAATDAYQFALLLKPQDANLHNQLAINFNTCGCLTEAMQHYQQAITLEPDYAEAHFSYALLLLGTSDFVNGWQEYAWRPSKMQYLNATKPVPKLAKNLEGQRILVLSEQGLGDELFFLRFIPFLKARGAWIAYRCGEKIRSIVQRINYIDLVLQQTESLPAVDQTLLVGDLPQALDMMTEIPPSLSFSPLSSSLETISHRLNILGKPPYIGITWRAGIRSQVKKVLFTRRVYDKEIPLSELANTLQIIDATFIAVQRQPIAGEIAELSRLMDRPVYDFSDLNDNLEEMLALLSLLDDYIGVSNTNIHLIAGLGKTAKILMPYPAEWRWFTTGYESPWFKNFPIYRQTVDKMWTTALQQLKSPCRSD